MEVYAEQQAAHEFTIRDTWERCWLPVQQLAKSILQRVLSDPLLEDLDVEDATGETVVIDPGDDEFKNRIDDD